VIADAHTWFYSYLSVKWQKWKKWILFPIKSVIKCHMNCNVATQSTMYVEVRWASECPDVKNYKWRLSLWKSYVHRMLYSCAHKNGNIGNIRRQKVNVSCERVTGKAMVITLLLASLNSCTNPWIYMMFSDHLRRRVVRCCHVTLHMRSQTTATSCALSELAPAPAIRFRRSVP